MILSGREKGVIQIPFEDLAGIGRKMFTLLGLELQLILHDGDGVAAFTCVYRGGSGLTGDLITERFFGHVVMDTTVEFADSGKNELRAPARWDTGPFDSSEQCEGTVTARETGLYSLADSGTSAEIPWSQLEGFGVNQDGSVVVKAGDPWFWFFALRPDAPDEWKALLEANGVLFGRDLRETETP